MKIICNMKYNHSQFSEKVYIVLFEKCKSLSKVIERGEVFRDWRNSSLNLDHPDVLILQEFVQRFIKSCFWLINEILPRKLCLRQKIFQAWKKLKQSKIFKNRVPLWLTLSISLSSLTPVSFCRIKSVSWEYSM